MHLCCFLPLNIHYLQMNWSISQICYSVNITHRTELLHLWTKRTFHMFHVFLCIIYLFLSIGWEGIWCWHRRNPGRTGGEENQIFVPGAAGCVWRLLVSLHITWALRSVSPWSIYVFISCKIRNNGQHIFGSYFWCFFFSPGILNDDGTLNNDASCLRLAEVALAYAKAGEPCLLFFKVVSNFGDWETWSFTLFTSWFLVIWRLIWFLYENFVWKTCKRCFGLCVLLQAVKSLLPLIWWMEESEL